MGDKLNQFKGTIYENGYGLIAKKVVKDSDLSIGAKGLYGYICSYAGNETKAFPGRELITHELNISKDTFNRYKNELIEKGYLGVTQVKYNGKFKHNEYELTNSPCPKSSDTTLSDTESSDTTNKDTTNNNLTNNNLNSNNLNIYIPFKEIIEHLNLKAGTSYKHTSNKTRSLITARWNEKYTLDDFKTVIDKKCKEWIGTDLEKYLRPETLFGTRFESYLNQKESKPTQPQQYKKQTQSNQPSKRQYDADELEKKLLGR